jgi:acyl carrier protein
VTAPEVEQTVRLVVARQLRVTPETLTGDSDLHIGLGVDDAQALALMAAVEAALDVRFPDDFLEGIDTFGQLSSAVRLAVGP